MSRWARAGAVAVLLSTVGALNAPSATADRLSVGATGGPTQTFVGSFHTSGVWIEVEAVGGPVAAADSADLTEATTYAGSVHIRMGCSTAVCEGVYEFTGEGRGTYLPLDPNKLRLYGQAGDMTFDVDFHGYGNYALWPEECGEYGCPGLVNPLYPRFLQRRAAATGSFTDPALGISISQAADEAWQRLLA